MEAVYEEAGVPYEEQHRGSDVGDDDSSFMSRGRPYVFRGDEDEDRMLVESGDTEEAERR